MSIDDVRDRITIEGMRIKVVALFCVTVIAILCILKLADPENILVNIIIAIGSFVGGEAVGKRQMDILPSSGSHSQTMTVTESKSDDPVKPV